MCPGWAWQTALAGGPCRWQACVCWGRPILLKLRAGELEAPALRMTEAHSSGREALRGKRLAQGHPASGNGAGVPALSRAPRAQHPLTWVGSPGAHYQEPASWASPRLEPLRSQHPSLLITPHSPPAGTCLPTPTLRREGVPMAPRPPHTLSSLAAHLPQPVSSRCCHTQQGLSTASQARCGGSH